MKTRLAILLWAANPDAPHLCATPFFNAAIVAAMDTEVEIYFTSQSVRLLEKGVAEKLETGPRGRKTVYDFMQHAAEHGVKFYACSHALEEYGSDPPTSFRKRPATRALQLTWRVAWTKRGRRSCSDRSKRDQSHFSKPAE